MVHNSDRTLLSDLCTGHTDEDWKVLIDTQIAIYSFSFKYR